jgi:hypothetical protein
MAGIVKLASTPPNIELSQFWMALAWLVATHPFLFLPPLIISSYYIVALERRNIRPELSNSSRLWQSRTQGMGQTAAGNLRLILGIIALILAGYVIYLRLFQPIEPTDMKQLLAPMTSPKELPPGPR